MHAQTPNLILAHLQDRLPVAAVVGLDFMVARGAEPAILLVPKNVHPANLSGLLEPLELHPRSGLLLQR